MSECENGAKNAKPSLMEFTMAIRGNRRRLNVLRERLLWVEHLIYSVPGPVYGGARGGASDPYRNRLPELIDRKDGIEREIRAIEGDETLLREFGELLTPKELNVFHLYYFKDNSQAEIALMMGISQQAICAYIKNINKKWTNGK